MGIRSKIILFFWACTNNFKALPVGNDTLTASLVSYLHYYTDCSVYPSQPKYITGLIKHGKAAKYWNIVSASLIT